MKKIVALMLSSVMLLSVLSVIPSAVLADGTGGASDVIADINFETQEQKDYYTVDNKTNMYNADIVNDGENTVVNFKQYAALIANSWENDDFARWGTALKINEANDGKLTAGSKISVSVDVKPGTTDNGGVGTDKYYIGIAFTNEPDVDDLGGGSSDKNKNGLRKISSEGKLVDIDMIDINNKEWQTASSEITVPENIGADEYAALVIYRRGDAWGHLKGSIYVDNIKMAHANSDTVNYDIAVIDFESDAQFNYYKNSNAANCTRTESDVYEKGQNGESSRHYQVWRTASVNKESTYADYAKYCGSIQLCNSEGTAPLTLEEGDLIDLSFDLKACFAGDKWQNGVGAYTIRLGLIFAEYTDGSINSSGTDANGIIKYVDEGKFVDICGVNPDESGWYRASKQLTVPRHGENEHPMLVLYTTDKMTGAGAFFDTMLDNIKVKKVVQSAVIDFESGAQKGFYGAGATPVRYTRADYVKKDGKTYMNLWSIASTNKESTYADYAKNVSSVQLCNTAGSSPLRLIAGSEINISFDAEAAFNESWWENDVGWWQVNVGLIFAEYDADGTVNSKDGNGIIKYIEEGKFFPLGGVNPQWNGWSKISKDITVPEHGENEYPTIILYTDAKMKGAAHPNVHIDNIKVIAYNELNASSVNVNFDDDKQKVFYGDNSYRNGNIADLGGEHGNALQMPALRQTVNGYPSCYASSLRLANEDATLPANFKKNSLVKFSADVKFGEITSDGDEDTSSLDVSQVYLGLIFTNDPCGSIGGSWIEDWSKDYGLSKYYSKDKIIELGKIDTENNDWQTVKANVFVPAHTEKELPTLVFYTKNSAWGFMSRSLDIYIDNIKAEATPPTDPDKVEVKAFKTGFEPEEYGADFDKYLNRYTKMSDVMSDTMCDFEKFKSNEYASKNVVWFTDSEIEAATGKGCMYIDYTRNFRELDYSEKNAFALLNSDGTNYQIKEGVRYHLKYKIWFDQYGYHGYSNDEMISFVCAADLPSSNKYAPDSIVQLRHEQTMYDQYDNPQPARIGSWLTYDGYFEATATGNMYFTLFCNFNNMQRVMIDDIEITPVSDENRIVKVQYMNKDGEGIYKSIIGPSGKRMSPATLWNTTDKFEGWYTADGKLFSQFVYPESDVTLYPRFSNLDPLPKDTSSYMKNGAVGTDFEDAAAMSKFYGSPINKDTEWASNIINDPAHAHSGSHYMGYLSSGSWQPAGNNPKFKFYAANTPRNWIVLEPGSTYRLTYWINIMDCTTGAGTLTTVGFDVENPMKVINTYGVKDVNCAMEFNKYQKEEQIINTGAERVALGLEMWSGQFYIAIDDVYVEKLDTVKLHFESNGGTAVADIEMPAYGSAVEPVSPTRNGYEFAGWYSDRELKNAFIFNDNPIKQNTTVYAKWQKLTPEPAKQYKTVYETQTVEEEVKNPVTDPELDEQINVAGADEIKNLTVKNEPASEKAEEDSFPWWTVIVIVAAVIAAAGTVTAVAVVKKRSAKKA